MVTRWLLVLGALLGAVRAELIVFGGKPAVRHVLDEKCTFQFNMMQTLRRKYVHDYVLANDLSSDALLSSTSSPVHSVAAACAYSPSMMMSGTLLVMQAYPPFPHDGLNFHERSGLGRTYRKSAASNLSDYAFGADTGLSGAYAPYAG